MAGRIRLASSSTESPLRKLLANLKKSKTPQDVKRVLLKRIRLTGLPLRVRPAFILLTFLSLLILSALGFHPTLAQKISPPVPFSDKLLHFVCFFFASAEFYAIWSVDSDVRTWYWRWFNECVSFVTCMLSSEFVQSLLPYKTFQWGDVLANILGTTLGISLARTLTIRNRRREELARIYQPLDVTFVEEDSDSDSEDTVARRRTAQMEEGSLSTTEEQLVDSGRKGMRMEENVWDDRDDVFSLGEEEEDRRSLGEQGLTAAFGIGQLTMNLFELVLAALGFLPALAFAAYYCPNGGFLQTYGSTSYCCDSSFYGTGLDAGKNAQYCASTDGVNMIGGFGGAGQLYGGGGGGGDFTGGGGGSSFLPNNFATYAPEADFASQNGGSTTAASITLQFALSDICTLAAIEPTGLPEGRRKRTRAEQTQKYLEANPACPHSQRACPLPSGNFECVEFDELTSCGGCVSTGSGVDCLSLPGVQGVQCIEDICVAQSCLVGFRLVDGQCA
ncbi:VanZ-like domain protein [Pseudohyphozyma bogoriensis]|nr:VanZ-like domain protein [Pseudohyphozyma bogoriensis]